MIINNNHYEIIIAQPHRLPLLNFEFDPPTGYDVTRTSAVSLQRIGQAATVRAQRGGSQNESVR